MVTLRQYELQYQNDLYTLNIICGVDDTSFAELSKPSVELSAKTESANLLLLKQYKIDSLKFSNQKKLVDLNYQPKLGAFADAGFWTSNNPGFYKNFGAGVGLNFSMPLYDGGQRKFQYQKITLASQISRNYQSFYQRQYKQQIQQLEQQFPMQQGGMNSINNNANNPLNFNNNIKVVSLDTKISDGFFYSGSNNLDPFTNSKK